jgi:serine/threonine protein phosphatase 1
LYYIIGDIHGYFGRLAALYDKLRAVLQKSDTLIFLGDYIDRGPQSYEVVDLLVQISRVTAFKSVFLKGNHEDMFLKYLAGEDPGGAFLMNGGENTIRSYTRRGGGFELPEHHREFFDGLELYYEGEDFIAVHAGLNPEAVCLEAQEEFDLLWIREEFYQGRKRWEKTVIFGHTPIAAIGGQGPVYRDERINIIGIDAGVIFGNPLVCLSWPEEKIITA